MKNIVKFLIVITLILFFKIVLNFTINEFIIRNYAKENYSTSFINFLYILNLNEPYIAYYNHGNLLYQKEQYKEAEEKYQIALKKNPKDSRVCDIQINLSLSKLKQIDMNNQEKALIELKEARNVLYENHCADSNDNSGKSKTAEQLEEEIKKLEEQLGGFDNQENEKEDDEQKEENIEEVNEKDVEEKLKENRQEANENRQNSLQYYERSGEFYYGKTW